MPPTPALGARPFPGMPRPATPASPPPAAGTSPSWTRPAGLAGLGRCPLRHTRGGATVVFGPIEPFSRHRRPSAQKPPSACSPATSTRPTAPTSPPSTPTSAPATCYSTRLLLPPKAVRYRARPRWRGQRLLLGLAQRGLRFMWAAEARVKEHLPTERITLASSPPATSATGRSDPSCVSAPGHAQARRRRLDGHRPAQAAGHGLSSAEPGLAGP